MTLATVQWVEYEQALNSAALIGWTLLATVHTMLAVAATANLSRSPLLDPKAKARWMLLCWVLPLAALVWFVVGQRVLTRRRARAAETADAKPVPR